MNVKMNILASLALLGAVCVGCEEDKPDYWGPQPTPTPTPQSELLNLAAGKFYKASVEPMSGREDSFPCLNYSMGVKLTDEEVGSIKENSLGVGWQGVASVDVVIDLGTKRTIEKVGLHAIEGNASAYLFALPSGVKFYGSADKQTWSNAVSAKVNASTGWAEAEANLTDCRYLKVTIEAPSANRAFLVDEITAMGKHKEDWKYVPKKGAYHGAFNNGLSYAGEPESSACPVDAFDRDAGKATSMMLWYQVMTDYPDDKYSFAEIQRVRKEHAGKGLAEGKYRMFMYGWLSEARDFNTNELKPEKSSTAKELAEGKLDAHWQKYFSDVKEAQRDGVEDYGPVWFRPNNEMNSNWVHWGYDAPNYVKFWRRMYNIAEQVGVTEYNVFVWSSNCSTYGKYTMKEYYPGDHYCDWIGTSCYYTTHNGQIKHPYPSYLMLETEAVSPNKPIMISEGAYRIKSETYKGCDGATWLREWFNLDQTNPRVKAVVYFNQANSSAGGPECRPHVDPELMEIYKEGVAKDYWLDEIPEDVYLEMIERRTKQNR
ncbi:MAG: endoglucanase [Tidjanibacter sp.]|nr:endoglucanase [Tidjanibacter sp.]